MSADASTLDFPKHSQEGGPHGSTEGDAVIVASPLPAASACTPTPPPYDDVPAQMRDAKRWLVWRSVPDTDPVKKPRKVPHYIDGTRRKGQLDSPEDLARLATFEEAVRALASGKYAGLGFTLGPDGTGNSWQGVDLDDLPDRPGLARIADDLPGYTELSPSGRGRHAIGYGRGFPTLGSNSSGIEAYCSGRFFTVTGEGAGRGEIEDLADFVERVLRPAHRDGKSVNPAPAAEIFQAVDPRTVTDLRSALLHMRADDRDLWVKMGHALKELGDVGRGLWMEWSATSEKFDLAEAARTWESFTPHSTGYKAVFTEAQRRGWVNPLSNAANGSSRATHAGTPASGEPPANDDQPDSLWSKPVDIFTRAPAPEFPAGILPAAFDDYAVELSAGSGFDVGAYRFVGLVVAAGLIDHQVAIRVGPMAQPAFLWGALMALSGGGKSPVISPWMKAVEGRNMQMMRESARAIGEHMRLPEQERHATARPRSRQLVVQDTTVEALEDAACDNPEGLILHADEISEFVGRLDAYGAKGAGKDRGLFLRAYNGGPAIKNRASRGVPQHIDNLSVAIIGGIQPAVLSNYFKGGGGSADGMFQRFVTYGMAPTRPVNYSARIDPLKEVGARNLIDRLIEWREHGVVKACDVPDGPGLRALEAFHNDTRTIADRTPAPRFQEHLHKFPGIAARITLTLHVLECAVRGTFEATVSGETVERALRLMATLYRHSEAVFGLVEEAAETVTQLARAAAEMILANQMQQVQRGDLTRSATGWQSAMNPQAEAALDLLIEYGWLRDVTPAREPGKPGRRSLGVFAVNPDVHVLFEDHARRIIRERAERLKSLQAAVTHRSGA